MWSASRSHGDDPSNRIDDMIEASLDAELDLGEQFEAEKMSGETLFIPRQSKE